ncbi:MAG: 7-cyano-7-deazaguanine synthase QueC [Pseudomonadota bacterium]
MQDQDTPNTRPERAIVLLSGGLDSATTLAMTVARGLEVWALSFAYGQRAMAEVEASRRLCVALGVTQHRIVPLALDGLVESALTGHDEVPADGTGSRRHGVPTTYVPARNTVFLALALGLAETIGAHSIVLGANALDYSGYPDCRPEYLARFNALAAVATAEGAAGGRPIRIEAPLMALSKADIIRKGLALGLDYRLTVSCYDPDPGGRPCGRCESCAIRARGFAEVGVPDPALEQGTP